MLEDLARALKARFYEETDNETADEIATLLGQVSDKIALRDGIDQESAMDRMVNLE